MIYRIFTAERLIFKYRGMVHEVETIDGKEVADLINARGYILNDLVYIFRGEFKPGDETTAGVYTVGDELRFVDPINDNERERYSIKNVKEIVLDIDQIIREISENKETFLDPEDVEIINANSEVSKFEIREDDDFLKKIIKQAIVSKEINLKNYAKKLPNKHDLGNMISTLNKQTKMSVVNFKRWCEMLGLKWSIVLEDDGSDALAPLKEIIEIDSDIQ